MLYCTSIAFCFSQQQITDFDAEDFAFQLGGPEPDAPVDGFELRSASVRQLPALEGQGISMSIVNLGPCAINQPHTHPRATEVSTNVNIQQYRTPDTNISNKKGNLGFTGESRLGSRYNILKLLWRVDKLANYPGRNPTQTSCPVFHHPRCTVGVAASARVSRFAAAVPTQHPTPGSKKAYTILHALGS